MTSSGSAHLRLVWWVSCVAYTVLIAILSLVPQSTFEEAPAIPHLDKIGHFVIYGLYAVLLLESWRRQGWRIGRGVMGGIGVYCALFGLLMEVCQPLVGDRTRASEPMDLLANTAGIVVFLAARSLMPAMSASRGRCASGGSVQ